jgi:hypothetical protein
LPTIIPCPRVPPYAAKSGRLTPLSTRAIFPLSRQRTLEKALGSGVTLHEAAQALQHRHYLRPHRQTRQEVIAQARRRLTMHRCRTTGTRRGLLPFEAPYPFIFLSRETSNTTFDQRFGSVTGKLHETGAALTRNRSNDPLWWRVSLPLLRRMTSAYGWQSSSCSTSIM